MAIKVDALYAALLDKVGFEVVSVNEMPNQLRLLGRIPLSRAGTNNINNWVALMDRLLEVMEVRPWKADLSKYYFKKKENRRTVYAWRIILQGENIAQHYADLVNVIRTTRAAKVDILEIPLGGVPNDRNNPAGGRRGAGPTDKTPVGPLAFQQRARGG
jgi:hypothetical protein